MCQCWLCRIFSPIIWFFYGWVAVCVWVPFSSLSWSCRVFRLGIFTPMCCHSVALRFPAPYCQAFSTCTLSLLILSRACASSSTCLSYLNCLYITSYLFIMLASFPRDSSSFLYRSCIQSFLCFHSLCRIASPRFSTSHPCFPPIRAIRSYSFGLLFPPTKQTHELIADCANTLLFLSRAVWRFASLHMLIMSTGMSAFLAYHPSDAHHKWTNVVSYWIHISCSSFSHVYSV